MLNGDGKGDIDTHVLDDPRVTNLWDGDRVIGRWLADKRVGSIGEPGNVVWDAYFAFGGESRWTDVPSGLLAAGSTIIDETDALDTRFIPTLVT